MRMKCILFSIANNSVVCNTTKSGCKAYGFYKDSMNGSSWWQSHHQQYIAGIANL
ncbi:MAG: hypothetical protein Q4D37_01235 [Oscillospiraceae bacterium]|nr:hypothetical protein [Oscillospiraceae bacterium]